MSRLVEMSLREISSMVGIYTQSCAESIQETVKRLNERVPYPNQNDLEVAKPLARALQSLDNLREKFDL